MAKEKSKPPRRFRVWLDKNVVGVEADEEIVEMPHDATDEECEEACKDCLDAMIGNWLDTGWEEIQESNAPKRSKGT